MLGSAQNYIIVGHEDDSTSLLNPTQGHYAPEYIILKTYNVVARHLGRPSTLVCGHIFDRTTDHKVDVASVLTSQENIRLVQWFMNRDKTLICNN
jgi:hypothetical protein